MHEFQNKFAQKWDKMLNYFDLNKDGQASQEEFVTGIRQDQRGLSKENAEKKFKGYDTDSNGQVTRDEFLKFELA